MQGSTTLTDKQPQRLSLLHKLPVLNKTFWIGEAGYKPILLLIAALFILAMVFVPIPSSLSNMVSEPDPSGYTLGRNCETITDTVNLKINAKEYAAWISDGRPADAMNGLLSSNDVARNAMIMVGILFMAAFLWGTEALPIGATNMLVAILMYIFVIMLPEDIAKAYMKDAVFFIGGILAIAVGVHKTGLDKRIGLLLLSRIKSPRAFAFIFFPGIAISAGFLSEHALVALLVPVLMGVYKATCIANGVKRDRALAVFLILGLTFAANMGGPGSPAAGGRNAIMVGYLSDMGVSISFGDWVLRGMPLAIALSLIVGLFMYIVCKPRFTVKGVNPSAVVKQEASKLPKLRGKEAVMAVILATVVLLWMILGEEFGLGGPTMMAVFAMFLFRIISWDDVQKGVALDVVGLYAAACAMGVGLGLTGGALWLARSFVDLLPGFMQHGDGLVMGVSILTGTMTNFMSDGATVGALGPIVMPMAELGAVSVWKVGLICSFASSFAMILIVGTPNNAIAFGMARDPETGERLISAMDFLKYGFPLFLLCLVVTWVICIFGYWNLLSWPV